MKILFFCGSLELGRDGVGDYTRRLAAECIRNGHACEIIALNDRMLSLPSSSSEFQKDEETAVNCLRLSSSLGWMERVQLAKEWTERFAPDLCSLQFVPFSFHDKGLCFFLVAQLKQIAPNAAWQVMFHELWVDSLERSKGKRGMWKFLQYIIIRHLIWNLRPSMIHSHARPYLDILKKFHPNVRQLTLFGNISGTGAENESALDLIMAKITEAGLKISTRSEVHLAGVFGAVYDEWLPDQFVDKWVKSITGEKKAVLVFFGKGFDPKDKHQALNEQLSEFVTIVSLGPLSESLVAGVINCLDFAIATTPWSLLEKSGSVAAFRDFGLPVVVLAEDEVDKYPMSADIYRASSVDSRTLNAMRRSESASSNLTTVAKSFLSSLKDK